MDSSSSSSSSISTATATTTATEGFVDALIQRAMTSTFPEEYIRGYLNSMFENMELSKKQVAELQNREAALLGFI